MSIGNEPEKNSFENILGKGENNDIQYFRLFPQGFSMEDKFLYGHSLARHCVIISFMYD